MIIEKGKTQRWHVAMPGRATWHDVVSMMSPDRSAMLTSAVGPVDVSIDQVNIDR